MTQDTPPRKTLVAILLLIPIACAGAIIDRYMTRSESAPKAPSVNAGLNQGAPDFTITSSPPATSPFTLIAGQNDMSGYPRPLSFSLTVAMHKNPDIDAALQGMARDESDALSGSLINEAMSIARYFRMTIQPLDEAGQPTAPASPLVLVSPMSNDPMGRRAQLMGRIPVCYPPRTRRMAIDVVCTRAPNQRAHWILGNLPKTHTATDIRLPLVTHVALFGPQSEGASDRQPAIVLEGMAAIVPDITPNVDPKLTHPHRTADGRLIYIQYPFDNHLPVGPPAIQLALRVSSPKANQFTNFLIGIDDMVCDWMPGDHIVNTPPGSYAPRMFPHSGTEPETLLTYCGPAYARSLKRLQVRGRVSERYRFERLTLPAADATYDPALRQYDVRWKAPVSATAPSGATIVGLNPWRSLPHKLHIPHVTAPPRREETTVFYAAVAWRAAKRRPETFMITEAIPVLENPFAPSDAFPPGHVSSQRPGINPAPMPGQQNAACIGGNSTTDMMSHANFSEHCLPGSNPVGQPNELISPSVQDLTKSGYQVVCFAIPMPVRKDPQSHPPIHLTNLQVESHGEVETHQWPFTLNLPFSKQIAQTWIPKPVVVWLGYPAAAGGLPRGSAGRRSPGSHPVTPPHRRSHKP